MPEELQFAIDDINEKDCQSAFEHDILLTYESLSDENGNLDEDEQLLLQGLINLSEAGMITANTEVQTALLKLGIEASELSCTEENISNEAFESPRIRPLLRPGNIEEIIENARYTSLVESEKDDNQYDILLERGFSPEIISFIENIIFPKVCGDSVECNPESIDKIIRLCLFVMDIETTEGSALNNSRSSASGYFHFLNQNGRDTDRGGRVIEIKNEAGDVLETRNVPDGIPDWNTIDLTLRNFTSKYYNNDAPDLEAWQRPDVSNINLETDPDAEWLLELWERNDNGGKGRDGVDFTFDDQVMLFLARSAVVAPNSFRSLLSGGNEKDNAMNIYREHHGTVTQGSDTERRMEQLANDTRHYGN